MVKPAAIGFLMTFVNGQPPHMIASQNVVRTEMMMHMASMGAGGLMLPPTVRVVNRRDNGAHRQRHRRQQDSLERLFAPRRKTRILAAPGDPDHNLHGDDTDE